MNSAKNHYFCCNKYLTKYLFSIKYPLDNHSNGVFALMYFKLVTLILIIIQI